MRTIATVATTTITAISALRRTLVVSSTATVAVVATLASASGAALLVRLAVLVPTHFLRDVLPSLIFNEVHGSRVFCCSVAVPGAWLGLQLGRRYNCLRITQSKAHPLT